MKIQEKIEGDVLTLYLNGNFDEITSPQVEKKLDLILSENIPNISFDLSGVQYISSAGIRILIIAHKKSIKTGKSITIGEMSEKAREILNVVGILPLFSR